MVRACLSYTYYSWPLIVLIDQFVATGPFSEVGSLKVLLIRPKKEPIDTASTEAEGVSGMGPMFDEYTTWWELNPNISSEEGSGPSFEVG